MSEGDCICEVGERGESAIVEHSVAELLSLSPDHAAVNGWTPTPSTPSTSRGHDSKVITVIFRPSASQRRGPRPLES